MCVVTLRRYTNYCRGGGDRKRALAIPGVTPTTVEGEGIGSERCHSSAYSNYRRGGGDRKRALSLFGVTPITVEGEERHITKWLRILCLMPETLFNNKFDKHFWLKCQIHGSEVHTVTKITLQN